MFYNNNIMNILTKTKNDILKMKNVFNSALKECSKNAIKRQNKVSFDKLFSFNVSKFCNFNMSYSSAISCFNDKFNTDIDKSTFIKLNNKIDHSHYDYVSSCLIKNFYEKNDRRLIAVDGSNHNVSTQVIANKNNKHYSRTCMFAMIDVINNIPLKMKSYNNQRNSSFN